MASGNYLGVKSNRKMSPFPIRFYDMVDDPTTDDIISWSKKGDGIVIWDVKALERDILPMYYKHNKMESLYRQLLNYGFHRISDVEYSHKSFLKGQKHKVHEVTRIIFNKRTTDIVLRNEVGIRAEVLKLAHHQASTAKQLKNLSKRVEEVAQNEKLIQSMLGICLQNQISTHKKPRTSSYGEVISYQPLVDENSEPNSIASAQLSQEVRHALAALEKELLSSDTVDGSNPH